MKKILFISTRSPYSGRYSGDVIGSKKIIDILKKNNIIDVVTLGIKENLEKKNIYIFKSPFLLAKIFYVIKSFLTLRPFHFGLFFSSKMKEFIDVQLRQKCRMLKRVVYSGHVEHVDDL